MTRLRKGVLAPISAILLIFGVSFAFSQRRAEDDKLYENLFVISGKVEIENHPEFGTGIGNSFYFILQRTDCKKCFFVVKTNADGTYSVTVSRGQYRIVAREVRGGMENSSDLLASDQPRLIDVTRGGSEVKFNVKVRLPGSE